MLKKVLYSYVVIKDVFEYQTDPLIFSILRVCTKTSSYIFVSLYKFNHKSKPVSFNMFCSDLEKFISNKAMKYLSITMFRFDFGYYNDLYIINHVIDVLTTNVYYSTRLPTTESNIVKNINMYERNALLISDKNKSIIEKSIDIEWTGGQ